MLLKTNGENIKEIDSREKRGNKPKCETDDTTKFYYNRTGDNISETLSKANTRNTYRQILFVGKYFSIKFKGHVLVNNLPLTQSLSKMSRKYSTSTYLYITKSVMFRSKKL